MKNKILIFAVITVLLLGITIAQAEVPPVPTTPGNITTCDSINMTYAPGSGNVTDSYNLTYDTDSDGSFLWANDTSSQTWQTFAATVHQNMTAYVYAYNGTGSGNLSLTNLSLGYAVANCPINMTNCTTSIAGIYGTTLTFDLGYTDGDGDIATFDGDNTFGAIDSTTGIFTWLILNKSDAGTYTWSFNVTESNATISGITPTVATCNVTLTVSIPASRGAPALSPIGIVAAIGLWSVLILVYNRRKR